MNIELAPEIRLHKTVHICDRRVTKDMDVSSTIRVQQFEKDNRDRTNPHVHLTEWMKELIRRKLAYTERSIVRRFIVHIVFAVLVERLDTSTVFGCRHSQKGKCHRVGSQARKHRNPGALR
jgi:urate oxidase